MDFNELLNTIANFDLDNSFGKNSCRVELFNTCYIQKIKNLGN